MATIAVENIALGYTCAECETEATQPLADIVSAGTLICPECGDDMELDSTHDVRIEPNQFLVTVDGCSQAQAEQVIAERISHDEDYGFSYTIGYEGA